MTSLRSRLLRSEEPDSFDKNFPFPKLSTVEKQLQNIKDAAFSCAESYENQRDRTLLPEDTDIYQCHTFDNHYLQGLKELYLSDFHMIQHKRIFYILQLFFYGR